METIERPTIVRSHTLAGVHLLLRCTYGLLPIIAGLDKFTDLLTHWENYLNPAIASKLPFSEHSFMLIVGVIEIIAGLIVLIRPVVGAFIVSAWLLLIACTLIAGNMYLDVAVRDIVMCIGAFSLGRISRVILFNSTPKQYNLKNQ